MRILNKILAYTLAFTVLTVTVFGVGNFVIEYPSGTQQLRVDESGNLNASGWIAETGVKLENTYIELTDTFGGDVGGTYGAITVSDTQGLIHGNISDWDTATAAIDTNCSVADSCPLIVYSGNTSWVTDAETDADHDECSEIANCVVDAWTGLQNLTLNDGLIYIGDASNNPAAQTMAGGATISNAGIVAITENYSVIGYQNISNIPTCGADEHLDFDGTTLECTADASAATDLYVNVTGDIMTGILTMQNNSLNMTLGANVTLSATSQVQGDASDTYMRIDSSGNFIIVLA